MQGDDLNKIFDIIIRKIWIIIVTAVVFAAGSFVISKYFIKPKYSAEILVSVYNSEGIQTSQDITTAQKLVNSYIIVLKCNTVMNAVAENVKLGYSASQIVNMVSAASVNNTEIFRVTVTCDNPNHAATIANAIADVAPDEIIRNVKAGAVEIIDRAEVPTAPSYPNISMNIILGILIGLVVSIAVVVLYNMLDTTVKDETTLLERYNLPIIGMIPEISGDLENEYTYGQKQTKGKGVPTDEKTR